MTLPITFPARTGRERACGQCGTVYRAPRANSRYCSNACRCRAKRGRSPRTTAPGGATSFTTIGRALVRLSLAGPIGPVDAFALTVPRAYALAELREVFNAKGWGGLSEQEFAAALSADGIQSYDTDSPAAAARKRLQARQRIATARLRKAA